MGEIMRILLRKSLYDEITETMEKSTWTQAGKHLETRTDKKGHLVHKWVSNSKNKPTPKRKGNQGLIDYLYNRESCTGKFRDGTEGTQPVDSMEKLWDECQAANKSFSDFSESVKQKAGAIKPILVKRSELKGQERAKEKLWEDEMEARNKTNTIGKFVEGNSLHDPKAVFHAKTLRDVDGHTFCCKSVVDVAKMLRYFDKQPNIIRIKNNFAKPSPVGYSDINMNIRLPNGTVAEIQLNTTANMVAKNVYGHSLYEVYRSVHSDPKYNNLATLMGNAQKKLYEMSNNLSKTGIFPDTENILGFEYKPYADLIRADVRAALPEIEMAHNEKKIDDKTYKHVQELVSRL